MSSMTPELLAETIAVLASLAERADDYDEPFDGLPFRDDEDIFIELGLSRSARALLPRLRPTAESADIARAEEAYAEYKRDGGFTLDEIKQELGLAEDAGGETGEVERVGRFGHHPDFSTDFCCEIDLLEGWIADIRAGTRSQWPFWSRLSHLLAFTRSKDAEALDAIAQRARHEVFELETRCKSALASKAEQPTSKPSVEAERLRKTLARTVPYLPITEPIFKDTIREAGGAEVVFASAEPSVPPRAAESKEPARPDDAVERAWDRWKQARGIVTGAETLAFNAGYHAALSRQQPASDDAVERVAVALFSHDYPGAPWEGAYAAHYWRDLARAALPAIPPALDEAAIIERCAQVGENAIRWHWEDKCRSKGAIGAGIVVAKAIRALIPTTTKEDR